MGNWKIKFEKLENEMERILAKIAGSSPDCYCLNFSQISPRSVQARSLFWTQLCLYYAGISNPLDRWNKLGSFPKVGQYAREDFNKRMRKVDFSIKMGGGGVKISMENP